MRFGTDGIRAKADFFDDDFILKFTSSLYQKYGKIKVLIGRDSRVSGKRITDALAIKLSGYGIRVLDVGVAPTPAVAYLTKFNECNLGIMISASHNPPEYNGIKLFTGQGAKISTFAEKEIELLFSRCIEPISAVDGRVRCLVGLDKYEEYLKNIVGDKISGKKILIDTCYGATAGIVKRIFEDLGCVVTALHDRYDGEKINVNCGATCPESLCKKERDGEYDLAFAYDGDGDRVICVKKGKVYGGDAILYAISDYLGENNGVVGTINSNLGLERAFLKRGLKFVRANVGDKFVYEEMLKGGFTLGGESSGHVIARKWAETGDGILTSVLLALADAEKGLEERVDYEDYPSIETFVVATEEEKEVFGRVNKTSGFWEEIATCGIRAVVRASGTEPKIRISVEGENEDLLKVKSEEIKKYVVDVIRNNLQKENAESVKTDTQNSTNKKNKGVTIVSPETTFIDEGVQIGEGTVVYPFNVIRGNCVIGKNVKIYSYCDLVDVEIGDNAEIRSSNCEKAKIGKNTTVGPFATIRKGAVIGDGCRVGDFVEIKNSTLGDGVKCAHLAYVGDAVVGERTNVGCGAVFANYNGKVKRKTEVGKDVFIGCNVNLIAPLKVGDDCFIAGGSTVTDDVENGKFVISRTSQVAVDRRTGNQT